MTQTLKNLLVLIVFVVLVALGYYLFTQRDSAVLSFVKSTDVSSTLLEKTSVFIERRAELEGLTLDMSLFTNPAFTSLRSYTTEIPDQSIGRSNIFDSATPVPSAAPVSIGR